MNDDEVYNNLKKCPHFNTCNHNLCPLDLELSLRIGKRDGKCTWMRERLEKTIKGRRIIFWGKVMPDALLNYVPESNLEWLNTPSKKRWLELNKNETKS